jgi:hypothetical protein
VEEQQQQLMLLMWRSAAAVLQAAAPAGKDGKWGREGKREYYSLIRGVQGAEGHARIRRMSKVMRNA